ncbi:N-acetylmuramidase family protein [Siculibacillus lacustris]|uniref:N-acetylmuramidase family protein n=1 Tax=Siculibacillus lacustris TaxID=1549641 RepID=A0A4Q9VN02_9HYPH|nr:N-acetylmuramidase family protein [Siculibacillus lacustris]TBW37012.1 N-acetylmuramidase family protein [Siculibacillus lacustris]
MFNLAGNVGHHQHNRPEDVTVVQGHLNQFNFLGRHPRLRVDGYCGIATISAIRTFQKVVVGMRHPDGIVAVQGPTWSLLSGKRAIQALNRSERSIALPVGSPSRLSDDDFQAAANRMGHDISPLLIKAFAEVESGGKSGFGPDLRPIIAYEGHIFRRLSKHRFDKTHPLLSYPYKKKAGPEWKANNHDQATAWETLKTATVLDHDAALQACSWGMFQVMGFNFKSCGYGTVDEFVAAMKAGEKGQLDAFVGYCIKKAGMIPAMAAKNFAFMATLYNGDDFGDYDQRIKRAYHKLGGS